MKPIGAAVLIACTSLMNVSVVQAGPPPGANAGALHGPAVLGLVSESIAFIKTDTGVQSSAVAVARLPGRGTMFATNCRTFARAKSFTLTTKQAQGAGVFIGGDLRYDTCMVFGAFTVPIVDTFNPLEVSDGQKVFAVAASAGSEFSVSEGVVSAKQGSVLFDPPLVIQSTASIAQGSSGVGLFDTRGRLLGMAPLRAEGAQALGAGVSVQQYLKAVVNPPVGSLDELNRALESAAVADKTAK